MGRALDGRLISVALALGAVILFGVLPLGNLLARSLFMDGAVTFNEYAEAFSRPRLWNLLLGSIALSGGATLIAAVFGVGLGFLVVKSTIPFRGTIVAICCLPLLLPPYVLANGWYQLGPGVRTWLFGVPGGLLILSTSILPLIFLLSIASFAGVNSRLEEAARLYSPWRQVVKRITLPMALPGIALAMVLAFLLAMSEFAAPSFLRLNVFAVESFTQLSAFYDPGAATAAWVPLLLLVVTFLLVTTRLIDAREHYFRAFRVSPARLSFGVLDPWVAYVAILFSAVLVLLPCGALVLRGLSKSALLTAWTYAADSIGWSFTYAVLAATVITLLGFFLGYASQRRLVYGADSIQLIVLILFAMPGPLAGFAVAVFWNHPSTTWIYGSSLALLSALAMQYAAVGQIGYAAGLSHLPPATEEAARIAGASWAFRLQSILLPLLRRTTVTVWVLAFILCLRDTTLPLLLAPPGRETLTARTLTLMANGSDELIAALCLMSIFMAIIPSTVALLVTCRSRA